MAVTTKYRVVKEHPNYAQNKFKQIILVNSNGYFEYQWYKLDGVDDNAVIQEALGNFEATTVNKPPLLNALTNLENENPMNEVEITEQDGESIFNFL